MSSACIFGSTARGRVDALSDKDVLVVAETDAQVLEAAKEWAGWSISKFTHQQMLEMAEKGAMFLQHLKQEGVIVRDDKGFLGSVISRFAPRSDYAEEACESAALLSELSSVQTGYWSTLCAADIAYGAIRNLAILQLASQGMYLFDYSDLVEEFASRTNLSEAARNSLFALRVLKHGYRERVRTLTPRPILANVLIAAKQMFGSQYPIGAAFGSGYSGLRIFELFLVGRADPRELDRLPEYDPLSKCWTLIRDPRGYKPKPRLADEAWLAEHYLLARKRFPSVE